jgi:hypothetical protein
MPRSSLLCSLIFGCAGRHSALDEAYVTPTSTAPATANAAADGWTGAGAPTKTSLAIALDDAGAGTTAIELVCGLWRDRQTLQMDGAGIGGTVWFQAVPAGDCTVYFKGGSPAQFGPVNGGDALRCKLIATTAVCEAVRP